MPQIADFTSISVKKSSSLSSINILYMKSPQLAIFFNHSSRVYIRKTMETQAIAKGKITHARTCTEPREPRQLRNIFGQNTCLADQKSRETLGFQFAPAISYSHLTHILNQTSDAHADMTEYQKELKWFETNEKFHRLITRGA